MVRHSFLLIEQCSLQDSFLLTKDGKPITWTEKGVISERRQENVVEPEEGTDNLCDAEMVRK